MRRVHLHFTKLFGCLVVEGNIPIDVAPLAKALADAQPHPHIYLAFGYLPLPVMAAFASPALAIEGTWVVNKVSAISYHKPRGYGISKAYVSNAINDLLLEVP
ncbi:hypothetical protein [Paraburkholderia sp. MM5384-R2]|uniref:hypothetical protein n=1 Tax=Paraburkholderia sp. MM5384-R2 TaxID=2723097 RepID=UPI001608344C|nr:hypothetical protein [Paraburkholderia sp. MM5384-R2]MBB5498654.1 hypothetical protein [Paraburkholderia sp. MM5384-R2]